MKIFELLEGGIKVAIVAFFLLKEDTGALIPLFIFPCVIFVWIRMRTEAYIEINSEIDEKKEDVMHVVHEICNQYSIIAGYFQRPRMNEAFAEKAEESAAEVHVGNLFNSKLLSVSCLR